MNNRILRRDCLEIALDSIDKNMPEKATLAALEGLNLGERVFCLAIGKAAWRMASAAASFLGDRIAKGLVITKKGHSLGPIQAFNIMEGGHPFPDERSLSAGKSAMAFAESLNRGDHLLVLLSGGGSALMELPMQGIGLEDFRILTEKLLASGAPISHVNSIRKRLSSIKAGRLALAASPAKVTTLILSDVLGNDMEAVASGPTLPDRNTKESTMELIDRYRIELTPSMMDALKKETPKHLENSEPLIIGDIRTLCKAASEKCAILGYRTVALTTSLDCEAREAGRFMAAIAREQRGKGPTGFVIGGETVVHLKGKGLGGRNQELALSAAIGIDGERNVAMISIGSDGTDGPTEYAGGLVDGKSFSRMVSSGIDPHRSLEDNDSNRALIASGDAVKTGPTGTNVNDLIVLLCL